MSPFPATPDHARSASEQTRWFVEEVQPHESKLRARFPSLTDVDDLVQEAYARLVRACAKGKVANPKPYLFATARNAALDRFRHDHVISFERVEKIDRRSVLEEPPNAAETLNHTQDLESRFGIKAERSGNETRLRLADGEKSP
ncbi:MAG: sigma factor [Opitutaceae bacterium]